jgi:hypothetical protein
MVITHNGMELIKISCRAVARIQQQLILHLPLERQEGPRGNPYGLGKVKTIAVARIRGIPTKEFPLLGGKPKVPPKGEKSSLTK